MPARNSLAGEHSKLTSGHFTVGSLLCAGKMLIYVIHFTSFVHILVYLVPDLSVLCLSCSYIDFWHLTALLR